MKTHTDRQTDTHTHTHTDGRKHTHTHRRTKTHVLTHTIMKFKDDAISPVNRLRPNTPHNFHTRWRRFGNFGKTKHDLNITDVLTTTRIRFL